MVDKKLDKDLENLLEVTEKTITDPQILRSLRDHIHGLKGNDYHNDLLYSNISIDEAQKQVTILNEEIEKETSTKEEDVVSFDIPPSPKTAIQPIYPRKALRDKLQGQVVIQAYIDEYGYVKETIILESVRKDLDKSAIKALEKSRFTPAKKDGKSVGVWISIPINFAL